MITIFKNKKDIPLNKEYIELNDIFFNQNTETRLDDKATKYIQLIDASELISKYKIRSRFEDITLNTDQLSTGCKTVLNVLYFPDKVFCLKECGNNALEILYGFEEGYVYSEYAMIPFNMERVKVRTGRECKVIEDYEELKEWWENENCEPVVMEHFSTVHTSFVVDFTFTNNITILMGDSGTGKTATFSFIRECMAVNPQILCLDNYDYQKDIKEIIRQTEGKLVVIDNADILLNDDTRKYISLDDKNQYLIIGRNPKNLFATKENLFELASEKVGEQTVFTMEPYI